MYYEFIIDKLPSVTDCYSVTRNTVWQITDSGNIIIIINDGQCRITCGYNCETAKKGDIVFIPAGHSYTREPIDMTLCSMTYIHFKSAAEMNEMFSSELKKRLLSVKQDLDEQMLCGIQQTEYPSNIYIPFISENTYDAVSEHIKKISLYSSKRPLMCGLQSSIALCEILLILSQRTIEATLESDSISDIRTIPDKLRKAVGYISKNFSKTITLDELAAYCAISKSQLIRYFKQAFGKTPLNYITDYRIAKTKELIFNYPHLTLKEISYELGFDNQHYFSRVFRNQTGETPTHYRDRTLNYKEPE